MKRLVRLLVIAHLSFACDARDDRTGTIVTTLLRADEAALRTRPELLARKFAAMAEAPFSFYRGSLPLFFHDQRTAASELEPSSFSKNAPLVDALGDPHPENFGLLEGADGVLRLEANDLDAADRLPFLWDLQRLGCGLALAGETVAPTAPDIAATIASEAALAYAAEIARLSSGGARTDFLVSEIETGAVGTEVAALFSRGAKRLGKAKELADLTIGEGTARRFRRGVLDPEDPLERLEDVPAALARALPDTLVEWHASLASPQKVPTGRILDVVREFGGGIASLTRIRLLLLVEEADTVSILEVKELADTGLGQWSLQPVAFDGLVPRLLGARDRAWPSPDADPRWGAAHWSDLPVQLRSERETNVGIKVSRLVENQATPEALAGLARALAKIVARAHARSASGVHAHLAGRADELAGELARLSADCAARVRTDHALFAAALATEGPLFGALTEIPSAHRGELAPLLSPPDGP